MPKFYILLLGLLYSIYGYTINDSLCQKLKSAVQSERTQLYNDISIEFQNINVDSSIFYAKLAVDNARKFAQPSELSRGYSTLGRALALKGELNAAEQYIDSALFLSKNTYNEVYVNALINKGLVLEGKDLLVHALEIYHQSLSIVDSLKLSRARANAFNSLGIVYKKLDRHEEALMHFKEALAIKREQNDLHGVAFILNNIGTVYDNMGDTAQALETYNEALKLNKDLGNTIAVAYIEFNIGVILKKMKVYDKAHRMFSHSLKIAQNSEDLISIAYNYYQLGDMFFETNRLNDAEEYSDKSMQIAREANLLNVMANNYYLKSSIARKRSQFKQSLDFYERYDELIDSLEKNESIKKVEELRLAYKKSRVEKQVKLLEKEKNLQDLKLAQNEIQIRNRSLWMILFLTGFILIGGFSILLFRQVRQKREANNLLAARNAEVSQQNEEIKAQRDALSDLNKQLESKNIEIEAQRDALEEQRNLATRQRDKIYLQKQNLTDNITYAARIQKALLPPKAYFSDCFTDHFIFNQPQGIVGGDFYWVGNVNSKIVLVTADSTGHGVTGGFMSILGISILNETVLRKGIVDPSQILNETRKQVVSSLHQSSRSIESKDGMDMTVFCFDKSSNTYKFSAANQKAYKVNAKSKELLELTGDNMPVAFYGDAQRDFTVQSGSYNSNDIFYLFSDGYPDQFGGKSNKKFLYKRFRSLVEKASPLTMSEQLDVFATTFYQWKGNYDQVDDLLVIGVIV